jgi:hypothetical protein
MCGNETRHSYHIYSARIVDVKHEKFDNFSTTATRYTDITKHTDHLCSKCASSGEEGGCLRTFGTIMGVVGLFAGTIPFWGAGNMADASLFAKIFLGLFCVGGVAFGLFIFYVTWSGVIRLRWDLGVTEDDGSLVLLQWYKNNKPLRANRVYLSSIEHRQLS